MAKVIIRSEVNALVEGVFTTDLNKAVLYGEISGDTRFVVSPINSVSNTNYTATQALLDADIRVSAAINVTLTPRQSIISASTTSVIFDITTGGTATVGTPVYSVVTATYAGGAVTSSALTGTQLTLTFPANTSATSKEITAKVKLTIDGNEFLSNLATVTQNAAGYLRFNPASKTIHSTGTTDSANYETNCTNIGVSGKTNITTATVNSGSHNVALAFPMNTASTQTTRTVTITGKTPDNVTISATYTITHQAALTTGLVFTYNGGDLPSTGGTIPSSSFTITLTNASLSGASVNNGASVSTGGTVTAPTITVTYPENTSTSSTKSYTITLTAKDIYNRTITKSVTITQEARVEPSITITITQNPVSADATSNTFIFVVSGIDDLSTIGWYQAGSSLITNCTVDGSNYTGSVTFPANTVPGSSNTVTVALSGTSIYGETVIGSASFIQNAPGYSPSISPATTAVTLPAYVEGAYDGSDVSGSVVFTYVDLSGYTVSKTSGITTATVTTGSTNTVRFTIVQNETTSAISPKGTITVTGKGLGGTDVTLVITVNQEAGVSPDFSLRDTPQSIAAGATSASDVLTHTFVNPSSIASTTKTGNISSVTIS